MCNSKTILIAGIFLVLAAWLSVPRYTEVATTTMNVGGVYKLDTWTGKVWLCEPTNILIDNKSVVAPKGCYLIKDTLGDGSLSNNI